jgi:hypothetical protein
MKNFLFDLLVTIAATFVVIASCFISWVSGYPIVSIIFALMAAYFLDVMFLGWKITYLEALVLWKRLGEYLTTPNPEYAARYYAKRIKKLERK